MVNLFLAGSKTLFLINDIIADETLNKQRQPLLGLAISGRHKEHSLWLLTQSYTTVPKNITRQAKMLMMKQPHTTLLVAPTGVGKTQLALDLLEK